MPPKNSKASKKKMEFKTKTFSELTASELYEILKARCAVFMVEQQIICQDMDDVDYESLHCFMMEQGLVKAYLRAYKGEDGAVHIGRVLTLNHGEGLGAKLMNESLPVIRKRLSGKELRLHSQDHAVGFYEKFGFTVCSEPFLEEGIVHVEMRKPYSSKNE